MEEGSTKQKLKLEIQQAKAEKLAFEKRISEVKAINLVAKLERTQSKQKIEDQNSEGLYGSTAEPRKYFSTYLRNQNKSVVSIVSINDRKSAILIRICTTLISGIISIGSTIN